MYLSDKRAINLFGLSPGPALRRGKAPNLLVYRRYGCRGFRGTFLFQRQPTSSREKEERRKKGGGIAADSRHGWREFAIPWLAADIPRICRDSYEFPTDPAILSRPHRAITIPSNRGGRVAVGKSIMCDGYFTLVVEMEILCSFFFEEEEEEFFSFDRVLSSSSGRVWQSMT